MDPTRLPHKTSLLCGCLSSRLSAVCCSTLILISQWSVMLISFRFVTLVSSLANAVCSC